MSITAEQVAEVLKRVIDPNTGRELAAGRAVRRLEVSGDDATVELARLVEA